MKTRIAEVFESIQGEGIYLGEKQIFVRFFGCNLNCQYCDTKLDHFMVYEPEELFKEIKLYQDDYHSISFTGGEPLLQADFLREALKLTCQDGYKNYLETNGTLNGELEEVIEYLDFISMDLKLPSSTGMGNLWNLHRKFLKTASQREVFLKAVICQSTSEDDIRQASTLINEVNRAAIFVLQPNSYENREVLSEKLERFKHICREKEVTTCIIPQTHKIMELK